MIHHVDISTSDTIALAAAFTAFCSLFITVWQGWIAWSHNRKSTRPILTWSVDWNFGQTGASVCFAMTNVGLGPAIVKARSFKINGAVFVPENGRNHVGSLLNTVLTERIRFVERRHGLPGIGSAIAAGTKFTIVEIEFPISDRHEIEAVLELIKVVFVLDYESIYGEKRTVTS